MGIRHGLLAGMILALSACGGGAPTSSQVAIKATPQATEHLISYGQSLSLGERAVVLFPTNNAVPAADSDNVGLMFAGGTRPTDLSSLVPFAEQATPVDLASWNIATPGETPLYGALLTIKGMDSAFHIGSAAGRGGSAIVDLSKGTAPYARLLAQVTAAKGLSPGAYSVMGIIWMQGESDAGNTNYAAEFSQLVLDLDHDIRAITGQGAIQFYVCETAQADVGAQQLAVAAAMAQVHIACHDSDYPTSDGAHLTAASSRAVGAALGTAIATRP